MQTTFLSYAQNWEDVFIERCFGDRTTGRYIDVGTSHPVVDSPTYASYCKGWWGINVEPISERVAELRRLRPRDITVQAVAGATSGIATFYRTDGMGGLSSCLPEAVASLRAAGSAIDELTVPRVTLDHLCASHGIVAAEVLKIDVEGGEADVLAGFSFRDCRPELLIIEAVSAMSAAPSTPWIDRLCSLGYRQVYDDAVNLFFLRQESLTLQIHFDRPVSVLDRVRQFGSQPPCLAWPGHPDHAWAVTICASLLRCAASLSPEALFRMLTFDIAHAALEATVDLDGINRAFYLVLGRWVGTDEVGALAAANLTLSALIMQLLNGEEFLQRLGRASAST